MKAKFKNDTEKFFGLLDKASGLVKFEDFKDNKEVQSVLGTEFTKISEKVSEFKARAVKAGAVIKNEDYKAVVAELEFAETNRDKSKEKAMSMTVLTAKLIAGINKVIELKKKEAEAL